MDDIHPIALVDCNNFYASCERVLNPELNKRPVVVLSHNDGIIISRSDEVKALSVPNTAVFSIQGSAKAPQYRRDFGQSCELLRILAPRDGRAERGRRGQQTRAIFY